MRLQFKTCIFLLLTAVSDSTENKEILEKFRKQITELYYKECAFIMSCLETGKVLSISKITRLAKFTDPKVQLNRIIDEIKFVGHKGFIDFVEILDSVKQTNATMLMRKAEEDRFTGKRILTEIDPGMYIFS